VTFLAVTVFLRYVMVMSRRVELPTGPFLSGLFIVLTCGHLYMGSRWARWTIGSLLLLSGCMFTYILLRSVDAQSIGTPVSLFFVTFSLMPGLFLMFSKDVSLFLDEKRKKNQVLTSPICKGESMNSQFRSGRIITFEAIVTILAVTVFLIGAMRPSFQLPTVPFLFGLFIVLTCGQLLYMGSRWARWVFGSLLLLSGCMFTYVLFAEWPWEEGLAMGWPVLVVLGTSSMVLGLFLMFSKSVSLFLDKKRTNRSVVASRTLKILWIVLLIASVVVVYNDLKRILL